MTDYSQVTEVPGVLLTPEALSMMQTRYGFAAAHVEGKMVLELACGAGQGLGMLARGARALVAGDRTMNLVQVARESYGARIPLLGLDALFLPFASATFDVIVLFEAIYYLPDAGRFLLECKRVLREGGSVLLCSENPDWSGFNPSPHSVRYSSPEETRDLLRSHGFAPEIMGSYEDEQMGLRGRAVNFCRRLAVRFGVIPKTMKGKVILKRLFYGRLEEMPAEIKPGDAPSREPQPYLPEGPIHKVIYAVGRLP